MQTAVIIMSILGCSPQATDCVRLVSMDKRWATVALCDVAAGTELPKYLNKGYPVVVSVCETPDLYDESEDGHQGEMVTRDSRLVLPGSMDVKMDNAKNQAIRVMRLPPPDNSILGQLAQTPPAKMVASAWSWVEQKLK